MSDDVGLTNLDIAELLSRAAEDVEDFKQRAYRRAARAALAWPEEAAVVLERERALTSLYGIGERLAGRVAGWLADPSQVGERPPSRSGFSTLAVGRSIVEHHPEWGEAVAADLQMHSTYSDGTVSIAEMVSTARDLGHRFVAITDHSEGLKIAGGMTEAEMASQHDEIDRLNAAAGDGFVILKGLEMNLDAQGVGDTEPEKLAGLDLVLGSFHSRLRLTEDQTDRYLGAVTNPHIDVLGHPRGRMYGTRAGLIADWERVFEAAADSGVAVEIDCNPNRQDLNAQLAALAAEAGCYVSIGTDAHSTHELSFLDLGRATAIAAGVPRERILNCMTADEVIEWAGSR